jgi:cytochrome c-type biogenesis protein CcmH/NrfG
MEIKVTGQRRMEPREPLGNFARNSEQGGEINRSPDYVAQASSEKEANDKKLIVKILDKIIGLSIFAIFFGVPLFFTGLTFQGVIFEKQLFFYFWLLLGLVSWTAKGVIIGEMNIRRTPLDIPIVGFWLVYLLATIFSVDRWHSFWGMFSDPSRGFMNITALFIAYYLIFSNFNKKRLHSILTAILASGSILTIWTFLAIRGIKFLPDSIAQYSPLSLVGSMSGLGVMFSCMIPLITVAILKLAEAEGMNRIFRKTIIGLLFVVLLFDLILIAVLYNFVPWLGLFCGVALFLIFILAKIVRPKISWTWLPMVLFVVIMALRMTGEISLSKVNLPVEVSPNYQVSWDIAINSLKSKFILGSGPSTYGYDFSMNRPQDFNLNAFYNLRFFQGTGIIFEALPTIGGIGTILLIIGILSFLSLEFYLLYREKERNKIYSLGFFTASVILLIDIISIRAEGTVLIFAALIAVLSLAAALYESGMQERYLSLSLKASPKYALALAFLFMVVSAGVAFLFVFLGKIYAADVYAGIADRQIYTNQEDSIMKMSKAIKLYDKEGKYYGQLGQYYMILANKEAMKSEKDRDLQKVQQYLNFSIAATRQSSDLAKNDVNSTEVLAQIYENAGLYVVDSLNLAGDAYKRGLELEPHNPSYYLKLGQIKVNLASTKKDEQERKQLITEANDLFQKSVDEKNNFDAGYYQLSLTQSALGDLDKAIDSATKAVQVSSQNLDYAINLARLYQARGKGDDIKTAEQVYKAIIAQSDSNISAHFYLGLLYEKEKNKNGAKQEYQKVDSLLVGDNAQDTKKQVEKMISNVEKGIENTPENLGLTASSAASGNESSGTQDQGAATNNATEEVAPSQQPIP